MKNNLYKSKVKFFTSIVLPSILAVVLFIVSLFYVVIPYFENAMMDRKREMITELTHAASSILEKYHKDESDSLLTRHEAQQMAISRIQYLRYGDENKDYFWITDMQPVMVVHPYRPELNGTNLENYLDSHGKQMFIEFVNVVKECNQGYVEYMWQWKDDSTHIVQKLSYVQGFKPWGWIVGTGIYIEDVKNEIAELSATFTHISIIISLIIALILFWISRQSFKIERKRLIAEEQLNQSNEKYRSLVEASTEGLIMYMDNQISFVNPVFERMADIPSKEIAKKNLCDIIEIPDNIRNKILNSDYDFNQISIESKILASNNKESDIILNILPINFFGKEAVIFSVKDISSDKLMQEELFYNKEKFQTLMDKLDQGIFRTSLDTKGRFLEANSTAIKILGYNKFDEFSDNYILDFFVEEEDKRNFRNKLLEKGFIKNQNLKLKKKNGEHILALVSLVVVYDKDTPRFCDGIITEINPQNNIIEKEDINHSFISFTQTLFQPAKNFSKNLVYCNYNSTIVEVSEKLSEENGEFALIKTDSGEIIGYLNDQIIRERVFRTDNYLQNKAYEIMSSPVPKLNENASISEAISFFKNEGTNFIALIDNDGKYKSALTQKQTMILQDFIPVKLISEINNAKNSNQLKEIHDKYIKYLIPIINNSTKPKVIFENLALLSDHFSKKIIELVQIEIGPSPVPFSFLLLGSEGRREQTLNTDQDNAIIYADSDEVPQEVSSEYFLKLGEKVCYILNEIGYNFCKGKIMAMNPLWCQPVSTWKSYFKKWINTGNAQDLLEIQIFFDYRTLFGDENLGNELKAYINALTTKNPAYLLLLAQNTMKLKPQVGFWGNILLETAGSPPETVNIKEAIMPIVNFARIYSLKQGITDLNTNSRLSKLHNQGIITTSTYQNVIQSLDYLSAMRLKHQASLIEKNIKPDNLLNTKLLSDLDKTIIKKVLSNINNMLSKLSYDFKGSM